MAKLKNELQAIQVEQINNEDIILKNDFSKAPTELQEERKQFLEISQQEMRYQNDLYKMKNNAKLEVGITQLVDKITEPQFIDKILANTKSAMDYKMLSDALDKLMKNKQQLQRLDTIDSNGTMGTFSGAAIKMRKPDGSQIDIMLG